MYMQEDEIEKIIKELEAKARQEQEPTIKSASSTAHHPINHKKARRRSFLKSFFFYLSVFVVLFLISYFGLNSKSYYDKAKYSYDTGIKKQSYEGKVPAVAKKEENEVVNLPDSIIIPKIGVNAPIIWQINFDDINSRLNEGVIHFAGTALPGQTGDIALTGHSSAYPWQKTSFGQVFALLDNLTPGDQIYIIYQKKKYLYTASDKKIVSENDIEILNGQNSRLILITCWPVGTSLHRLVIFANKMEQQNPPAKNLLLPNVF